VCTPRSRQWWRPRLTTGPEFFLISLNFNGTSDNRIGVWSLTNTATLNSTPNLFLQDLVLKVKPYTEPPSRFSNLGVQQEVGPWPYPQGMSYGDPEESLDGGDNRMQQVYYVGGQLYSAITSTVYDCTSFVAGVEWFIVKPSFQSGALRAVLSENDYLAVKNENLIYPAVALDSAQKGAMTFTLSGPDFYPSAAFVKFNAKGPTGTVNVLAQVSIRMTASPATTQSHRIYSLTDAGAITPRRWPMAATCSSPPSTSLEALATSTSTGPLR